MRFSKLLAEQAPMLGHELDVAKEHGPGLDLSHCSCTGQSALHMNECWVLSTAYTS